MFSARFDKQDEDHQVSDEIELYLFLNLNQLLKQSDSKNIDIRFQLEGQIKKK